MSDKLTKLQSRLDKIDAKLEKIEKLASKLDAIEHKVSYTDLALMKMNGNIVNSSNDIKETRRHIHNLTLMLKLQGIGTTSVNTPADMFQQPTYGSSPNGNTSMYKPTCNFRGDTLNAEHTQPFDPFKPYNPFLQDDFLSVKDAYKRFEELNKLAQEQEVQEEQVVNAKKAKNTDYIPTSMWSIERKDWADKLKELNINATISNSANGTLVNMNPEAYHGIIVYDTKYPDRGLKENYAWYPVKLVDSDSNRYAWTIVKLV